MTTLSRDALLTLGRDFMESRILLTAAQLNLFTHLAAKPLTADALAARLSATPRGVTILLDALTAIRVLTKHAGEYRCEPALARYLSADSPESILPMLLHSASLWRRWSQLTDIVRGDVPPGGGQRTDDDMRAFIGAMDVVAAPLAASIAKVVEPGSARSLLDIGCGPGTYTRAFLQAAPNLKATLFDQPAVIEMARANLEKAGLATRATFVPGDFDTDELPKAQSPSGSEGQRPSSTPSPPASPASGRHADEPSACDSPTPGHDLALLSAIIHQNSPAENVALYGKVHRALAPGGRLIIRDHILEPDRTASRPAAVFAVNMLVGTQGGNCYTYEEIREDLSAAGFTEIRLVQKSDQMAGLVEAIK